MDEAVACGAAIYAGLQNKDKLNTAQKKLFQKLNLMKCVIFIWVLLCFL